MRSCSLSLPAQRDRSFLAGLRQVAFDFLLDEQGELTIASVGEAHPVGLPQQALAARNVRTIGGVVAGLVGKLRLNIDELDAIEVGLVPHDVVHHLGRDH